MNFFKKPSPKEAERANKRELRRAQKDIERSAHSLETDEAKLESSIKRAAKDGNMDLARSLAKSLVQLRQTKTRNMAMSSKVQAVGTQQTLMASNVAVANSLGSTAKQMDPQKTQNMLMNFSKENAKLEMTEDMMNDVLSDMLEDDTGAEDAVITQVLDEIGVDLNAQILNAPGAYTSKLGSKSTVSDSTKEYDEIERRLHELNE